MRSVRNSLILSLILSPCAWAEQSGDSELKLWQITYSAPTRYADGYTVKGKAKSFSGTFRFENGQLSSLKGKVPITSLNTGLEARDASLREILFKTSDGRLPDLEFTAEPASCTQQESGWACDVQGSFKIRDEWQTVRTQVYVSTYQGKPWLHAEGKLNLSKYGFYASSAEALKVADEVNVALDLLGKN